MTDWAPKRIEANLCAVLNMLPQCIVLLHFSLYPLEPCIGAVVNPIRQPCALRICLLSAPILIVHEETHSASVGEKRPANTLRPLAVCFPELLFAVVILLRRQY